MASAHALSIGLDPANASGAIGDSFSFNVVVDFTGDPTLGGGFDVMFDSAVLGFVSYDASTCNVNCDAGFGRAPDVSDGLLSGIAFGQFNGITGPGIVGTVTFAAIGSGVGSISLSDTANAIVGPFVSAVTFAVQDVEYSGATVDVAGAQIPLPAAAWLLIGGLGSLFGFRRKV
jgi:hypothetical protein